ncbi:MAG TPA: DegV family protein [Ktedonobacterales bacterium]
MTVRILVDSTADIPLDRAQQLGIEVVPLAVLFGDQEYLDGVDLTADEFYNKLAHTPVSPTTSAPSPGMFEAAFRKLFNEGAESVLALMLGKDLSATYGNARQAASVVTQETGKRIEVVDSGTVSGGFGMPAEMLANEAPNGATLEHLKARAESLCSRVHLYAALDTLEYLQRGGRIGRARQLIGSLLNVKPILEVRDSHVLPVENVRTRSRAQERVGQLIKDCGPIEAMAIVESSPQVGEQYNAIARTFFDGPIYHYALGPVVGTHAGPGAGGIVAITREQ